MKRHEQNSLSNIELGVTPLSQNAEGKLLGGFIGMQGNSVDAAANEKCTNNNCKNKACSNYKCINPNDCSNSGTNEECTNGTTATPSPTKPTPDTTLLPAPDINFFYL